LVWIGDELVELMKRLKLYATFSIKGHTQIIPMGALHSFLKARHGNRYAGHWVAMTATIRDVPIVAMAYAWSQKGRRVKKSLVKYESKFEDEWETRRARSLISHCCSLSLRVLIIDHENNKQRQAILASETGWLTRDHGFVYFVLRLECAPSTCIDCSDTTN
jgi:hypothetical protein